MTEDTQKKTFLGFDFSTQRLKALVIDEDYAILQEADVEFDVDLPEFRTAGGVRRGEGGEVTAPPLLWVKALDMVLERLVVAGVDFARVQAVSGAAQQHGSVWWSKDAESRLSSLSPEDFLHTQLATAFVADSPVWMDSSTTEDCKALEEAVGGPEMLAKITGSTAYERFTGPQIRKMLRTRPRVYHAAARVSLVSSFAASLLLGRVAAVDLADASGMNLLDIDRGTWSQECLEACGDAALASKLGAPVASASVLGAVAPYYARRYGFRADCSVVAFTGDNCSALVGLRLRAGWVGLSLGTSDTLLLALGARAAPPAGHVLLAPARARYCALLCFANGSLTRQAHRDRLAGPSWRAFDELLGATVRGNMGYMGIYLDTAEIAPRAPAGRWVREAGGREAGGREAAPAPQVEARALLEGQALARRAHAEDMGLALDASSRLIATGGASANKEFLQIFADVFNTPVYVQEQHANAALLGAAFRAAEVWSEHAGVQLSGSEPTLTLVATPYPDAEKIYTPMLARYRKMIEDIPKLG